MANMRLAVHTIPWGDEIKLQDMLADIRNAGYEGVELFQHPDSLGGADTILQAFLGANLTLVGICTGSMDQKTAFLKQYAFSLAKHMGNSLAKDVYSVDRLDSIQLKALVGSSDCPYIYIDEWHDTKCRQALEDGFRLALHPHMFKPIQTLAEAELFLATHPDLLFLPDTAHLTIAGEDIVSISSSYLSDEKLSRLAGFHFKNWKSDAGRSFQFYARGFCALPDNGEVELEKVLDVLIRRRYRGWIVVEQDWSANPRASIQQSFGWLRKRIGSFVSK